MQNSKIVKQYFGRWWLPDNPKNTVTGNFVIYEHGSYKLDILDFFDFLNPLIVQENADPIKIIRGVAMGTDSKKTFYFHLLYNHLARITHSRLKHFRISNSFYLISQSKAEVKSLMFDSCFFKPLNLENWLNEGQAKMKYVSDDEYDINFKQKSPQILQKNDDLTIGIYYGYNMSYPNEKGFKLESIPSFGLKFEKPTAFQDIRKILNSLNWFMTLICFSPTNSLETTFIIYNSKRENDYFEFKHHDKFVDSSYKEIHRSAMLINKEDVLSKSIIIKNWLDFHEQNEYFVRNYIANFRNSNQFSDTEFLNLVLGIITYSEKHYDVRKRTAFKSLKIVDLKLSDCYKSFMVLDDRFFKKVEATRHYYVHESTINKDELIDVEGELFKYTLRLKFLATAIILKSIGFTPREIDEKLSRKAIGWVAFESKTI